MDIIGHRGARGLAPENTWSSICCALQYGVRMLEIDVHLSRDAVVVLHHDEKINRCTNARGWIEALHSKKLSALDAGSWFHPSFKGERLPFLCDLLTYLPHEVTLMIEMKHQSTQARTNRLARAVWKLVQRQQAAGRVILASSNYRALKHLGPAPVRRCFIYSWPKRLRPALADQFKAVQSVSWNRELWDDKLAARLRKLNKAFYAWVINDPGSLPLWKKRGIKGVITDYPDRFKSALNRRRKSKQNAGFRPG
jgi:glycerophosphoryl diester phosphodiesterase